MLENVKGIKMNNKVKLILCLSVTLVACNSGIDGNNNPPNTGSNMAEINAKGIAFNGIQYLKPKIIGAKSNIGAVNQNQYTYTISNVQNLKLTSIKVNFYDGASCSGNLVATSSSTGTQIYEAGKTMTTDDGGNYALCSTYNNSSTGNKSCTGLYTDWQAGKQISMQFNYTVTTISGAIVPMNSVCLANTTISASGNSSACTVSDCGFNMPYYTTFPGGTYFLPYANSSTPLACDTVSSVPGSTTRCSCIQDPVTKDIWYATAQYAGSNNYDNWKSNGTLLNTFNSTSKCGEATPGTWHLPNANNVYYNKKGSYYNYPISTTNPGGGEMHTLIVNALNYGYVVSNSGGYPLSAWLQSNGFTTSSSGGAYITNNTGSAPPPISTSGAFAIYPTTGMVDIYSTNLSGNIILVHQ